VYLYISSNNRLKNFCFYQATICWTSMMRTSRNYMVLKTDYFFVSILTSVFVTVVIGKYRDATKIWQLWNVREYLGATSMTIQLHGHVWLVSNEPDISVLMDGFLGKLDADSSTSYLVTNFQLPRCNPRPQT